MRQGFLKFGAVAAAALSAWAADATSPDFPDIHYGRHFRQILDVYLPPDPCGLSPVVMFVPGGGWLSGEKTQVDPYVDSLLARGFAVVAFDTRYSYQAIFPAQINDCKAAVRWVRGNAQAYGLDPDRIAMFGDSSGGHLSALTGTSGDVAALEGKVGDYVGLSSRIQAVGDFFGPTDLFAFGAIYNSPFSTVSQLIGHPIQDVLDHLKDPKYADLVALLDSADPITHVTPDDPPCYITHGDADDVVPLMFSQILDDALDAAGVPSFLDVVPGGTHELEPSDYENAFDFFAQTLISKTVPADLNCDGEVNVADLFIVINAWGDCPLESSCRADIDRNGVVDVDDLFTVINAWSNLGGG